jgi:hypothetical protein
MTKPKIAMVLLIPLFIEFTIPYFVPIDNWPAWAFLTLSLVFIVNFALAVIWLAAVFWDWFTRDAKMRSTPEGRQYLYERDREKNLRYEENKRQMVLSMIEEDKKRDQSRAAIATAQKKQTEHHQTNKSCSNCGKLIEEDSQFCRFCGCSTEPAEISEATDGSTEQ